MTTQVSVEFVPAPGHESDRLAILRLIGNDGKPPLLSPPTLTELARRLAEVHRNLDGTAALIITGQGSTFAAGADLTAIRDVTTRDQAVELGRAGHRVVSAIRELPVPTLALIKGTALGGGLELALACDYRVATDSERRLGLPETSLGLIPGWGGTTLLPRLIGVTTALDIIIKPTTVTPRQAYEIGLVDHLVPEGSALVEASTWLIDLMSGEGEVTRAAPEDLTAVHSALNGYREKVSLTSGQLSAPAAVLDTMTRAAGWAVPDAFALEDQVLADLIMTDTTRATLYAQGLIRSARKPPLDPPRSLARRITKVGIIGAGLMAAQIAAQVARTAQVPVVMRDLDSERIAAGLAHVDREYDRQVGRGRMSQDTADAARALISATTELTELAECDFVIEAVTEQLQVKQRVFAELEPHVSPATVLATNTSALSVTKIGDVLRHPERVVGVHFFNPVAAMPLIEIVHTPRSQPEAVATAYSFAHALGKSAVGAADSPGFIVNRLLILLLGRILAAVEGGTPVEVANASLDDLGLPMPPFQLLDLVGPAVALHVLQTLRNDLGESYPHSPGLERIAALSLPILDSVPTPAGHQHIHEGVQAAFDTARLPGTPHVMSVDEVRDDVLAHLTAEIGRMLSEGVVQHATHIDVAMLLGAGWPSTLGGISPFLDRTGYSQRILGKPLLPDGVANVPGSRTS